MGLKSIGTQKEPRNKKSHKKQYILPKLISTNVDGTNFGFHSFMVWYDVHRINKSNLFYRSSYVPFFFTAT